MRQNWILLLALAALGGAANAQNTLTAEEKAQGFKLMFDGKSMKGWDDPAKKKPAGDAWTIDDGCLKAVPGVRIREDLTTTERYGDFEMLFDWKVSPKGNSGVKYRLQEKVLIDEALKSRLKGKRFEDFVNYELQNHSVKRDAPGPIEAYVVGFEFQVIDNGGHADARRGGKYQAGALYDTIAPVKAAERTVGEFNQSKLIVKGDKIQHWLNGELVVDASLNDEAIASNAARRWGKDSPVYGLLTKRPVAKSVIALQHHGDAVWFRNLRIRRLD
jgi:hypothetical protein